MGNCSTYNRNSNPIINEVEVTGDILTGRAGLSLSVRHPRGIVFYPYLEALSGKMRRNHKGQDISEILKQLFCFFMDGTSRHLAYFDTLKGDEGYSMSIETNPDNMLSSHAVKRFFAAILLPSNFFFRKVLQKLFLWRLHIEQPLWIVLVWTPWSWTMMKLSGAMGSSRPTKR